MDERGECELCVPESFLSQNDYAIDQLAARGNRLGGPDRDGSMPRERRAGTLAFPRQVPLRDDTPVARLTRETADALERDFRDRPARICWGMRDVLFGEPGLDMWRAVLPQAKVTRIDDAGHFVQEDAHERVIPELVELLASE